LYDRNIKAIAFDLGGVLLKENDILLSPLEQALENQIGKINPDSEYYSWAAKQLDISKDYIEKAVQNIILNLYELRDPDILPQISSKFPALKLAIASNHITAIQDCLKNNNISHLFHTILISGEVGVKKPEQKFYEILAERLEEKPNEILFIDDLEVNVNGAKKLGYLTMQYKAEKYLLSEIKKHLE
jgi:HAD superfamily hydrolase (TIGR01509 family)